MAVTITESNYKQATQDIIRTLVETNENAGATLVELDKQGRQLKDAEEKLDHIHESLTRGERFLHKMKSFFSRFSQPKSFSRPQHYTERRVTISVAAPDKIEGNDDLDIIINGLGELKLKAQIMTGELEQHNTRLEHITEKTDLAHNRLRKDIHSIRKLM